MLIPIPSFKRRGVRREGPVAWRAYDDDPQFVFAPRLFGASYLVFELRNAGSAIDPRVYVDSGKGFDPQEEIELRPTQNGIYVVSLRSFGRVRRVRFDPSTFPSQFELRAFAAYGAASVRAFIGRRLRQGSKGKDYAPICQTIAASGDDPALTGLGPRASKIRSVTQHFEQVIALASARHADSCPWPGDSPLISFITPVFDTPTRYLDQLLQSFAIQRPGAWELVLCDDGSSSPETIEWLKAHKDAPGVRIIINAVNGGIAAATNLGVAQARGDWVALIDHDDALTPFAVDQIAETIAHHPEARFIYTDEVVVGPDLEPQTYFLKPAFDPVLLSGVNYINHLSIYQRDRLRGIGGLRLGYEGSQDYDLLLRYFSGLRNDEVFHLPYPAYLWRRDKKSYTAKFLDRATQSARRAISEQYSRAGESALVDPALDANLHRVRFDRADRSWPPISIVIPSRDAYPLISRTLDNLLARTEYPSLEIIIADNGTKDRRVLDLYEKMRENRTNFRAEILEEPFNFSRQVNRGIRLAQGEHILLLNNDIEVTEPNWLKEMVSCFDYPDVGVVGARLLYPNGSLQHAGVIVGLGSVAGHWFCGMPNAYPGPMSRLNVRQSLAAVTGACMLVSRQCVEAVGLFDEEKFAIAYNDVDFCLRAGREGFRVVWTPFATLYHHESATRGSDETKENIERFNREKADLREKYGLSQYVDPAFSPYYDRMHSAPRFTLPPTLPQARLFCA